LSYHSLRHGLISALANAGVPPELRKKISGHQDDASHGVIAKLIARPITSSVGLSILRGEVGAP
jgi:hypothetical protein